MNNLLYQEGCLVSKSKGRGLSYIFERDGDAVVYQRSNPSEFFFKDEYLNKCFVVEYYEFLGDRYIYSAKLIEDNE